MRNSKYFSRVSVAPSAATAFAMVPSPVQGHEIARHDASSDVLLEASDGGAPVVDAASVNGDITRLRAVHAKYRVRVRLRCEWRGISLLERGEAEGVSCPTLDHNIDYGQNNARSSVPRSCLGRPTWVRIGASSRTVVTNEDTDEQEFRFDDALSDGEDGDTIGSTVGKRRIEGC